MRRLIDADELKEWIEAWFDMNKYYHPYSKRATIPTVELFDILDRIPTTIDPVKHGHWTNLWISMSGNSSAECSLCGVRVHDSFCQSINYCPNCGAKMDEEG